MLTALTIDDQTGHPVPFIRESKRRVTEADGFIGTTTLRTVVRPRPQADGQINDTRWQNGRIFDIYGLIIGTDPADAMAELRAICAPMLATLGATGQPALLKWTEQGLFGLSWQSLVRLADAIDPPLVCGPAMLRYQAILMAEDPMIYPQPPVT
jgi:hypothetical protein